MTDVRGLDLSGMTIVGQKFAAGVESAVVDLSLSWDVGTVAELAITLLDESGRLTGRNVAALGSIIEWDGSKWQVGSVDTTYASSGAMVTVRARSSLAKRLRSTHKTGNTKGRNVRGWLQPLVRAAGGTCVVQASPTLKSVSISNDQTVLDAIGSVTSAANMAWTEHDGVLYAGTPWWAHQGGTGLPTWPLTWQTDDASDVFALSATESDDDKEQTGTVALSVPNPVGVRMRPWHLVDLSGTGSDIDGTWLVTSVQATVDGVSPVDVQAHRPRRSKPKAGGTASTSAGASTGGLATASGKAAIAIAYAKEQLGEPYSYSATPPTSWDCAKLTQWAWRAAGVELPGTSWEQASVTQHIAFDEMEPGDLLFYFTGYYPNSSTRVHHVAMYIGGGQKIEAGSPVQISSASSWIEHFSYAGRVRA